MSLARAGLTVGASRRIEPTIEDVLIDRLGKVSPDEPAVDRP